MFPPRQRGVSTADPVARHVTPSPHRRHVISHPQHLQEQPCCSSVLRDKQQASLGPCRLASWQSFTLWLRIRVRQQKTVLPKFGGEDGRSRNATPRVSRCTSSWCAGTIAVNGFLSTHVFSCLLAAMGRHDERVILVPSALPVRDNTHLEKAPQLHDTMLDAASGKLRSGIDRHAGLPREV